jgi:hypothetical protein
VASVSEGGLQPASLGSNPVHLIVYRVEPPGGDATARLDDARPAALTCSPKPASPTGLQIADPLREPISCSGARTPAWLIHYPDRHIGRPPPTSKLRTDPARMARATFAFSHPSNFSVRNPFSQ